MRWLGYREVKLSSIVVDAADIRARMKLPHVIDLAENIRVSGGEPMHAPVIRHVSSDLVGGRDRFAASMLNKAKRLWVHITECTVHEAKELELAENIYRRADNRSELIAQLVALKEQQIRAVAESKGGTVSQLAPQTVTANARKEVARAAGVSTAAVRKAQQRAAAKDSAPEGSAETSGEVNRKAPSGELPAAPSEGPAPTIDLLGVPRESVADAVILDAAEQQRIIDEADALLRRAQAVLGGLGSTRCDRGRADNVKAQVQRVAHLVRSMRPHSLCLYCKAYPGVDDGACKGTGLATKDDFLTGPAELKDCANPRIALQGQFVPFPPGAAGNPRTSTESKLATKPAKATEGKPRKITVKLPDGTTYDPEEPWSPPAEVSDEEVPF